MLPRAANPVTARRARPDGLQRPPLPLFIRLHRSGQLMCYENRTTSKATDRRRRIRPSHKRRVGRKKAPDYDLSGVSLFCGGFILHEDKHMNTNRKCKSNYVRRPHRRRKASSTGTRTLWTGHRLPEPTIAFSRLGDCTAANSSNFAIVNVTNWCIRDRVPVRRHQ